MVTANPITNPTATDIVRQQAPNGGLLPVIEALSARKPFLQDASWMPCNMGAFHRINRRNSLPSPTRRRINQGVAATKSTTQQVDEITVMESDKAVVDCTLIALNGAEYRMRELVAHMEGLEQQFESDVIYGSLGTDPDGFDGLISRLNATTSTPAGNQIKLVDESAAGSDQGSMLLVGWAPHGVHCIYPPGMPAGIKHVDYGEVSNGGSDGTNTFPAFVDWFEWHYGIAVEDFRYVARAANIDTGAIQPDDKNLVTAAISLIHKVQHSDSSARWALYVPKLIAEYFDHQAEAKVSPNVYTKDIGGAAVTTVRGIPVRTADKMLITEDVVA